MSITIGGKVRIQRIIERLKDLPAESIEEGMKYIARVAPERSKQRLTAIGYVKTGKTLRSITGEAKSDKAIVRAGGKGAQQVHILEYGAEPKPHLIKPNVRKSLFWNGAPHPVRVVKHPGGRIRAGNFLRGPIEDMQESNELESILSRAITEVQERLLS